MLLDVTPEPVGATVGEGQECASACPPLSIRLTTRTNPVWLRPKRGFAAVKTRVSLERDVRWDVELRALAR